MPRDSRMTGPNAVGVGGEELLELVDSEAIDIEGDWRLACAFAFFFPAPRFKILRIENTILFVEDQRKS